MNFLAAEVSLCHGMLSFKISAELEDELGNLHISCSSRYFPEATTASFNVNVPKSKNPCSEALVWYRPCTSSQQGCADYQRYI